MRFAFIEAEKANFPIAFMCARLEVSRSGYYAWRGRGPSQRALEDQRLAALVVSIHGESKGRYGSPRVSAELRARGQRTSRKRVARLMQAQGLSGRPRKRRQRTTDSQHALPVAENLLGRDFHAEEPNRVWVTDITYIWTREGWLYLAAILDLYSRAVVGWAMSERIDTELCLTALAMAVTSRRPPPGLTHHSDRGSQYASRAYRRALEAHGMLCSMSRKGDCWDNAVAESFWGTLKAELIEGEDLASRAQARRAVFEYIEVFYNRRRRHSSIQYRSPLEHEALCAAGPLAA